MKWGMKMELVHLSENQVIVWKSPDGKLFEDESKYQRHMVKIRDQQAWQDAKEKIPELKKIINTELRECKTLDEIGEVVVSRWNDLLFQLPYIKTRKNDYSGIKECRVWYNYWYRETFMLSNTHKCPEGGVRNWNQIPNTPTFYPGVLARISLELNSCSVFSSDMFAGTLIKTGTGGGGGDNFAYDLYIFKDDFPNLDIWEIPEKLNDHNN